MTVKSLDSFLMLSGGSSAAPVEHRLIATTYREHRSGIGSGLALAFAFKIDHGNTPIVWRQTFELRIKGKSKDGHAWGYMYRFSVNNRNVHPFCPNTDGIVDQYRRTHSWQMPSYQYWWDPQWNPSPAEKAEMTQYLNCCSERVVDESGVKFGYQAQDRSVANYLVCQSKDAMFAHNPHSAIIDYSLNNDQWYVFEILINGDGNGHLAINGFDPTSSFVSMPARDLAIELPTIDVGDEEGKITTELKVICAPRVGNNNITVSLANIWLGFLGSYHHHPLGLASGMLDSQTGNLKNLGNGRIKLANNKDVTPFVYLSFANGFTNAAYCEKFAVYDRPLEVHGDTNARHIVSGSTLSTHIASYTPDKPNLLQRCDRVSISPVGDALIYEVQSTPDMGVSGTKQITFELSKDEDWSSVYVSWFGAEQIRITILIRADPDPAKHMAYKWRAYRSSSGTVQFSTWRGRFNGPKWISDQSHGSGVGGARSFGRWGVYANALTGQLRFSWGVTDKGEQGYAAASSLGVSPIYDGKNVLTIEINERYIGDTGRQRYDSALLFPFVLSKTKMDAHPEIVQWAFPHQHVGYFYNTGTRILKDPGMDGSKYLGTKPSLFCHPANGLGFFADSANNKLPLCIGYNDYSTAYNSFRHYECLTTSPFIETYNTLTEGMTLPW